jgi:hypothetical protein
LSPLIPIGIALPYCEPGWIISIEALSVSQVSEAAVAAAQRAAHIPPASKTAHTAHDYGVNHASFVLAYTKDNLAHVIYPGGVTADDWAQDLPLLVKEAWSSG